jgi:DMSO/TMAO reductase YedYZ molybdopterin-dependent catalytic subunit
MLRMPSVLLRLAATLTLGVAPFAAASAQAAPGAPSVELIGLAGQHRTVTAADLARMPHVEATVSSHNVEGKYRGVALGELLKLVDRPAGEALRGKALATAVSVEASDGYRIVFALAEIDSGFTNKVIFLADSKNGGPIDATEGPFRLVVPDEKRPARWAKLVTRIRLVPVE